MSNKPVNVGSIGLPNYEACTPAGRAAQTVLARTAGLPLPATFIEKLILKEIENTMSKPTPEDHLEDAGVVSNAELDALILDQYQDAVAEGFTGTLDEWKQNQMGKE